MKAPIRVLPWSAVGLILGTILPGNAQTQDISPFLPRGVAVAPQSGAEDPSYELRGFMSASDGTRFCIFDSRKKQSVWVSLNETGHSFVVISADREGSEVTLRCVDGRRLSLALRGVKVDSLGAVASAGQVGAELSAQPGNANYAPARLTPDQEQELNVLSPKRAAAIRRYFLNIAGGSQVTAPATP